MDEKYRNATHLRHLEQIANYNEDIDTLLIGDSIIERFEWYANKQFNKNVLILAKGGDKIEHLYYRLNYKSNPNFTNIKNVIFEIGANNLSVKKNNIDEIVKNINIIYKKIKEICPNSSIKYIPLYYFDEINPEIITNLNKKLEEVLKHDFLKDFWNDILPNHYDKSYFEDKIHLNKKSYDKFYDKINKFI
jgi:hypothetical protein